MIESRLNLKLTVKVVHQENTVTQDHLLQLEIVMLDITVERVLPHHHLQEVEQIMECVQLAIIAH
jgi:hypothetical protein